MTTDKAETIIGISAAVTFGSVAGARAISGNPLPDPRQTAGVLIGFGGIAILANAVPDIAGTLATIIAGTAFGSYGLPILLKYFDQADFKTLYNSKLPAAKTATKGKS